MLDIQGRNKMAQRYSEISQKIKLFIEEQKYILLVRQLLMVE